MTHPSLDAIRAQFPALASATVFLDNAGGSQLPNCVIDAATRYMRESFVQVGGDYTLSRRATDNVEEARQFMVQLMGAEEVGEVALGPSTTAMCTLLANSYADQPVAGRDEIVVTQLGHEANLGPWTKLEKRGYTIKVWRVDPESFEQDLDELRALVSERTRVLALCHASNILGRVEPIEAATRIAHDAGARVVVDGVAFAPHRAIDVAGLGVDWYVFSTYKVYGPHMAALFGRHEAFAELPGPNHFFLADESAPHRFELGGASHEGCAGLVGLRDYFAFLAGADPSAVDRRTVVSAYQAMEALEQPLQERFLAYLRSKPAVRIIGSPESDARRMPTISFVHATRSSREIALAANELELGLRFGHFYAQRLCTALGLDGEDGVVRTSFLHYNTLDEVERTIAFLDPLLA